MHVRRMEDHQDAYFCWKEQSVRNAVCVHVDAHLDVSNFKAPGLGALETPELNCANFLHRALDEGLVGRLIWVIPPHLAAGRTLLDWANEELPRWMHLSVADARSLHARDDRVEGTLLGRPFTVCTSATLPHLPGPVLLDVDIDYFLGPADEVWQTPETLKQALGPLNITVLTIAVSVWGGYTPHHLRELAEQTEEAWTGRTVPRIPTRPRPFDQATFHFIRKQHAECREWLTRVEGELAEAGLYLEGMMHLREGHDEEALSSFDRLLSQALDRRTAAHLLDLCGRSLARLGRHPEAIERFQDALRRDGNDASILRELASSQKALGQDAARTLRKAVALAPEQLASALARFDLAEFYLTQGQPALAQAEVQALQRTGLPPQYSLARERLALKVKGPSGAARTRGA